MHMLMGLNFSEIPSAYSWGWLLVNDQLLRRIVQSGPTQRSPFFLDLLNLFGRKTRQINEDYPVCKFDPITKGFVRSLSSTSASWVNDPWVPEINYNLTHPFYKPKDDATPNPGEDGREFRKRVTHKWVLRKMAISARDRTFVFLQPSDSFKRKLRI